MIKYTTYGLMLLALIFMMACAGNVDNADEKKENSDKSAAKEMSNGGAEGDTEADDYAVTEYEDEVKEEATDDIEIEPDFSASKMFSKEELSIYETRAIQKVQDAFSYLQIITDNTIDPLLREETGKQLLLFFAENQRPSIEKMLENIPEEFNLSTIPENIDIPVSLAQSSDNTFKGELSLKSDLAVFFNKESTRLQIEFTLQQIEKQFGDETELVWEVMLGKISVK